MIHMPLAQIIEKITENSNLTAEDVNSKINTKLEQLSGLISKEGAAHIIANELGVKLVERASGRLQIKNILAGMRNVETVGKVQAVYEVRDFVRQDGQMGKVGSFILGDETGTIRIVCWGSNADLVKRIRTDDIIKIKSGLVKENNSRKEVHMNDRSAVLINPEEEKVGTVVSSTREERPQSVRKSIKDLEEADNNIELLGTVVQVFEPKFFEICPTCGKRAKPKDGIVACDSHGAVTPDYSYVMNLFLDDGTDNIRVVCFRNQAQHLLKLQNSQILTYKDSPADFDSVKNEVLGNIVKFTGRVVKNPLFNRTEFIAQIVDANPDPKEELKRLENEELVKETS